MLGYEFFSSDLFSIIQLIAALLTLAGASYTVLKFIVPKIPRKFKNFNSIIFILLVINMLITIVVLIKLQSLEFSILAVLLSIAIMKER